MNSEQKRSRSGRPVVVVEIGSDWLKMIQAENTRAGLALSRVHLERFETIGSALARGISAACRKQRFARIPVLACLPRQMANIRVIDLPSRQPAEIVDMVDLQAAKQTPYSREEIVFDYRIAGGAREGYTRVMLAIVQRSILRQRFSLLEEAGLEVDRMSISTEGVFNWARIELLRGESGAVAVLDVDSFYADFTVMAGQDLLFTRGILVGANQLLNSFEMSKQKLARELRLCMETWRGENPGMAVERLVLSGAAPGIPELEEYLSQSLNVAVEVRDSLANVRLAPSNPAAGASASRSISLTPLIGMSAAPERLEFNLVPDAVRIRRTLLAKARSLTALGMLLMTTMITFSALGMLRLYFKKNRLALLRREVVATGPRAGQVERWKKLSEILEDRRDLRFSAAALLSEIHRRATDQSKVSFDAIDLKLENSLESSQVVMRGTADNTGEVRSLVKRLEDSPLLKDVQEGETTRERSGRYRFNLVCSLERETET